MCSGSEAGSYLRLIDSCITQLKAQGPSGTCNESKEEAPDLGVTGGGEDVEGVDVRGRALEVLVHLRVSVWGLRTTTSQKCEHKCEAVPRRARI